MPVSLEPVVLSVDDLPSSMVFMDTVALWFGSSDGALPGLLGSVFLLVLVSMVMICIAFVELTVLPALSMIVAIRV